MGVKPESRIFLNKVREGKCMCCEKFFHDNSGILSGILDMRYSSDFSDMWDVFYKKIERERVCIMGDDKELIDFLSDTLFREVFRITGEDDLAAFVCDDVEILYKYIESDLDENWVNLYMREYLLNRFPYRIESDFLCDKKSIIDCLHGA